MHPRMVRFALVLCVAVAVPVAARAQAFGLNEIGSCAVGRTSAGTAAPCPDGSAIFWNPAAATRLPGTVLSLGASAIAVSGGFSADTSRIRYPADPPVEYPPYLFANVRAGTRAAVGLGVFVPYGLTSQWTGDFPGRFSAQKASLASVYVQPNLAIDIVPGRVSIGGGPVFGYSTVELVQGIDLSEQIATRTPATITFAQLGVPLGTEFASVRAKGHATAWGFHIGVQAQLTPTFAVGARYLSKLAFRYDDLDARFRPIATGLVLAANNPLGLPANTPVDLLVAGQFTGNGALTPQKAATAIDHPAQFQAGIAFTGLPATTLLFDYELTEWSSFDKLPVTFAGPAAASSRTLLEDFDNSLAFRSAVEHRFGAWTGRLGFTYAQTPAPDVTVTPLLPDMNRFNYAAGVSIPFADRFTLDAGYLRVETSGRRGRVVERIEGTPSAGLGASQLNGGFYQLHANVFSLGLRAHF